jgi:hypothetical protein
MTLVQEAFYVCYYLFSVGIPYSLEEMPNFINNVKNLYKIKQAIKKKCVRSSNDEERGNGNE